MITNPDNHYSHSLPATRHGTHMWLNLRTDSERRRWERVVAGKVRLSWWGRLVGWLRTR